jgi:hypothetical protein
VIFLIYILIIPVVMFGFNLYVEFTGKIYYGQDRGADCFIFSVFWPVTMSGVLLFFAISSFHTFCVNKSRKIVDGYRKIVYNNVSRAKDDTDDEDVLA